MRNLWYTGYVVSSLTFLALAYVEWQVPGFVSHVFPMYIVALLAIICGLGALVTSRAVLAVRRRFEVVAVGIGVISSVLVFQAAGAFGAFRLVLAMIVLILPLVLLKALSDVKE